VHLQSDVGAENKATSLLGCKRMYSCCNGDVGRFRFPQSSGGNVVEIARLFGLHLSCVKVNRTWASRCYECDPVTSRRPLTNLRAAECALLPKRILRCRLVSHGQTFYTIFG